MKVVVVMPLFQKRLKVNMMLQPLYSSSTKLPLLHILKILVTFLRQHLLTEIVSNKINKNIHIFVHFVNQVGMDKKYTSLIMIYRK